jgi:hypothetical protein
MIIPAQTDCKKIATVASPIRALNRGFLGEAAVPLVEVARSVVVIGWILS